MRIGILGGSFNPVHNGHLALAAHAFSELNLSRVYFVPSQQNPLKKKDELLPPALRLTLLKKAIKGKKGFLVSDCELKRPGPSYTIDTLRAFKKKLGKNTGIYFLAGADNAKSFSRWKSSQEVLKLCRFVVVTRPGSRLNLHDKRFLYLPMPPVDISSSDIRRRLKAGQKLRGLVPIELESTLKRSLATGGAGGVNQRRKSSKPKRK